MSREEFEGILQSNGYSHSKPEFYIKNFDGEYLDRNIEKAYKYWLKEKYASAAREAIRGDPNDKRIGINDKIRPDLMKKRFRDWG